MVMGGTMTVLKCKMCGGNLEITDDVSVCECEYCGTKQTVPTANDEKKIKLFERANKLRLNCEFDKAAGVYETIVSEYSEEAEGYWGLILCRYGIEYVDDPLTGKKIPTCHRSSFESIMDDEDFELVMENSDSISRVVYREEAKRIEEIRKGIIEVSGKEKPYDIFICYKETDENGGRTLDSVLAQDVYDELTNKGYRVFFSRITLEDKLGVEYEPYIFAALNSAKIMLAFGTSYDNYNSVWVKNEWSRYLKLMTKDKTKHLIPCFKNVDAYDIPKEFSKLQSQDMGKIGAIQDLMRGIDKFLVTEVKKENNAVEQFMYNSAPNLNGNAFLKRGYMAIEDSEWKKAIDFFEQVLNIDAENGQAYWGELLAENKCADSVEFGNKLYDQLVQNIKSDRKTIDIKDIYVEFQEKYHFIMNIFSESDKENYFNKEFYYYSKLSSINDITKNNEENFILNDNKLFQRAFQYADEHISKEIEILKNVLKKSLYEITEVIKAEEEEAQKIAFSEANNYLSKLNEALHKSDKLARKNAEVNKANFDVMYLKWKKEKELFPVLYSAWELQISNYNKESEIWKSKNENVFSQWNEDKRIYVKTKAWYESQLAILENEKAMIDGFRADKRIAAKEKEISKVKFKLNNLTIPVEPKITEAPKRPVEPVLSPEPKISFDEIINKPEVLKFFFDQMKE